MLIPEKKHSQKALSLVESAIVMGIAGMVFASIWATVSVVHQRRLVEQGATEISTIIDNLRAIYTGQTRASASPTLSALVCAGVFPHETLSGPAPFDCTTWLPQSPWGGQYGVFIQIRPTGNAYTVGFANVATKLSTAACLMLVSRLPPVGTVANSTSGGSASLSGGIALPVLLNPPVLETTQEGLPLGAYVTTNNTSWTNVTGRAQEDITKNVLGSNGCTGVAFSYSDGVNPIIMGKLDPLRGQDIGAYEKITAIIGKHWDDIKTYSQPAHNVPIDFVEGFNNKI